MEAASRRYRFLAAFILMEEPAKHKPRRLLRWPKEARQLVIYFRDSESTRSALDDTSALPGSVRDLVTALVTMTTHSRDACLRFVRQLGVTRKQQYRGWTIAEQQRLLDLIGLNPPHEVAKILRRSPGSIRSMLNRLGASAQMGRDWFTTFTLAEALHVRVEEVQRWIDQGWLKCRTVETGRLKKKIIDADDFAEFCKQHRSAIIGRRLNAERLDFVRNFVFPPSHVDLLPVRESKKERAAYEAQVGASDASVKKDAEESGSAAATIQ
jgi:hypothetical protein